MPGDNSSHPTSRSTEGLDALALARLAAIVESSDDAIITKDLNGTITSWNAGASRIFGYSEQEAIGEPIILLIPPQLQIEEAEILAKIRAGKRVDHFETTRLGKDGRAIDVSITVSPLRDASGNIVGASKIARDITERKRTEGAQRLMMDELNHRIKNTLAIVQALSRQSLRYSNSNNDFVTSFTERLQSLAKTHTILSQSEWDGADLATLVDEIVTVSPVADDRVRSSGPYVLLDSQTALQLAMVFHELATNARKHGALSSNSGRLSVTWETRIDPKPSLTIVWRERAPAMARAPRTAGFGITLIEQTIRGRSGETLMQYAPEGLMCEIRIPLSQMPIGSKAAAPFERPRQIPGEHGPNSILQDKRILIIEGEPAVALDLADTVQHAGCRVVGPIGDMATALTHIASGAIDAALLDSDLQGESTSDLAASLTDCHTPFAFVTGHSARALPAGFRENIVLSKPCSQGQLLVVLETLLYPSLAHSRLGEHRRAANDRD